MTAEPSPGPSGEQELLQTIGDLLNGTATAGQRERLNDLLRSDEGARRTYRRYVNLHAALRSYGGAIGAAEEIEPAARAVRPAAGGAPRRPAADKRGPRWIALLAALATAVVLSGVAVQRTDLFGIRGPSGVAADAPVAVVTKAAKARCEGAGETLEVGSQVGPGPLRLTEGFAEITFDSGTRVVLEAPVTLRLVDARTLGLELGRIVAHVPLQARGFSVETPRANVVDLGTEFGVGVRDSGDTEVQVFQGVVVTTWKGPGGEDVDRRLEAGQAISIDHRTELVPKGVDFCPEGYVRTFPTDRDAGQPGGPLYNRSRFDTVHVVRASRKIVIDGDLSDWDRSGAFYSACLPPYHENYYVEGMMMYDDQCLYLGAHVGDPAPMRSRMDPGADPDSAACAGQRDRPDGRESRARLAAAGHGAGAGRSAHPEIGRRPQDTSDQIVHMTMWYHQPQGKPRLHLSHGMDFHGERTDPAGWQVPSAWTRTAAGTRWNTPSLGRFWGRQTVFRGPATCWARIGRSTGATTKASCRAATSWRSRTSTPSRFVSFEPRRGVKRSFMTAATCRRERLYREIDPPRHNAG